MKKRALSLVLTLTMALTMLPATALAAGKAGLIQLSAPTELSMGTYYREDGTSVSIPSMLCWKKGELHQGEAEIRLMRVTQDGDQEVGRQSWIYDPGDYASSPDLIRWEDRMTSGDYYYTVQNIGDGKTYASSEVVRSETWTHTLPEQRLDMPTNAVWNGVNAVWSPSGQGTTFYNVIWYFSSESDDYFRPAGETWNFTEPTGKMFDALVLGLGKGSYMFKVRAMSGDITKIRNSEWSEVSPELSLTDLSDAVNGIVGGIPVDADAATIQIGRAHV